MRMAPSCCSRRTRMCRWAGGCSEAREGAIETRDYYSSRGKALAFLCLCLAFVAIGAFALNRTPDVWPIWLAIGLFSLGVLMCLILLVRPQRLILDRDGFTMTGGFTLKP